MDFFDRQDEAKRKTLLLVVLYAAALASLLALLGFIYFIVAITVLQLNVPSQDFVAGLIALEVIAVLIIGFSTLYRVNSLRAGGYVVAEGLGGKLIEAGSRDPYERRLFNVVEEMAIASGTPVPPVYVLENENRINAFAAGNSTEDAVIGVTRGTLRKLSRDELQGVIAHEFSHIINADTRINTRLIGVTYGLIVLMIAGLIALRIGALLGITGSRGGSSRGGEGKNNQGAGAIALAVIILGGSLIAIGFIGRIFAELIRGAVSRQREYLADAGAVQFTRNPAGIGMALRRIGMEGEGNTNSDETRRRENRSQAAAKKPDYTEVSHMLFASAIMTHPPIKQRIERIDPYLLEAPLPTINVLQEERDLEKAKRTKGRSALGSLDFGLGERMGGAGQGLITLAILSQAGNFGAEHVTYARDLLQSLPENLTETAHQTHGARAIVYGLLLDKNPKILSKQLEALKADATPDAYKATVDLAQALKELPSISRLPLVDIAIPALRRITREQYTTFRRNVQTLIDADEDMNLSEWLLQRIVVRNLDKMHGLMKRRRTQLHKIKQMPQECLRLLSAVARAGHQADDASGLAFAKGMRTLDLQASRPEASEITFTQLDEDLDKLDELNPSEKRLLLKACADTIEADNEVTSEQAEFYRIVSQALHCPTPPLSLQPQQGGSSPDAPTEQR